MTAPPTEARRSDHRRPRGALAYRTRQFLSLPTRSCLARNPGATALARKGGTPTTVVDARHPVDPPRLESRLRNLSARGSLVSNRSISSARPSLGAAFFREVSMSANGLGKWAKSPSNHTWDGGKQGISGLPSPVVSGLAPGNAGKIRHLRPAMQVQRGSQRGLA